MNKVSKVWRITTARETSHLVEFGKEMTATEAEIEFRSSAATYSTVTNGEGFRVINVEDGAA
jgi:hypothetical protein